MTVMNKAALRKYLRGLYEGDAARAAQSLVLSKRLMDSPVYQRAAVIGGYIPLPHEADIMPVLLHALENGKTLALPLCGAPPHMTFRRVKHINALVSGAYGIPEPPEDSPVIPADRIDLLLVPLEGIDRRGFRLGKGGGYYDAVLSSASPYSMGCALTWQWVGHIPTEPWDQPLNACADERGIHYFKPMSII